MSPSVLIPSDLRFSDLNRTHLATFRRWWAVKFRASAPQRNRCTRKEGRKQKEGKKKRENSDWEAHWTMSGPDGYRCLSWRLSHVPDLPKTRPAGRPEHIRCSRQEDRGHESADVAQFPHAMASDGRRSAVSPLAPKKLGWQSQARVCFVSRAFFLFGRTARALWSVTQACHNGVNINQSKRAVWTFQHPMRSALPSPRCLLETLT